MTSKFNISLYLQKKALKKHFQKSRIDVWIKEAKSIYKSLVLKIPDIGDKTNGMFSFLQYSIFLMPIVLILKRKGIPARQIGNVIYDIAALTFNLIPSSFRGLIASDFYSSKNIQTWKKRAERSIKISSCAFFLQAASVALHLSQHCFFVIPSL